LTTNPRQYSGARRPSPEGNASSRILPLQIVDYLLDRIEAVHHQMVAEYMLTEVFAALHTDINDDERLVHHPSLYRPTRKRRSVVEVKVHARKHLLQRRGLIDQTARDSSRSRSPRIDPRAVIIDLIEPPQRNSITTGLPLASPRPSRGELDCVLTNPLHMIPFAPARCYEHGRSGNVG